MAGSSDDLAPGYAGPATVSGYRDFLSSLRSRIDAALDNLGVVQPENDGPTDGAFRPSPTNPDLIEFTYLNRKYTVSSIQLLMMFTLGSLVQVGIPDPVMNPGTKFFGVSPSIEAFLRTLGSVPPGDYAYRLTSGDYATWLKDIAYASNDGNNANQQNPGGGAFSGSNTNTKFQTKPVSCLDLANLTFFLDNETNQAATLYALSAVDQPAQKNGQFASLAVPAGSLLPVGVNLETTTIPYMVGQAVFGTAPTSGYLRLLALARRAV